MELKDYQQTVIKDLEDFLGYLDQFEYVARAFQLFWQDKGVKMDAYKHTVKGVPNVCIKVPTAGGKTFIAINALRPIFDNVSRADPSRPKVAVWLVPSVTILDQTIKALKDPQHPYSLKLKTHFNGRVEIFSKADVLQGIGFNSDTLRDQLNIVILSFDSLRSKSKENRKLYQENENLSDFDIGGDETSVINVIQSLRPVVIVDESHNAETPLSIQMLENLNPNFILDLTATPRNNSNIISFVNAAQLKKNHMVKLPVVVQNQRDKSDVIANALNFRRQLEEMAIGEEQAGGSYIRPIVLFQAEPKNAEDATTFQDIKDKLIELGIPDSQVKIKTAVKNEIKDIDLMSRECPVRFIVTVNALKEGWDCPFAYILASVANKGSAVDVEQILGRVLRQPSVKRHKEELLNLSYVFTSSNKFLQTLQNIVKGLNQAGFSNKDYRVIDDVPNVDNSSEKPEPPTLFPDTEEGEEDEIDISKIEQTDANQNLEELKKKALEINQAFESSLEDEQTSLPTELEGKTNMQKMKEVFVESAAKLVLPQFFIKVQGRGGFFDDGQNEILLESEELLTDFKLSQADANIDFDTLDSETYYVDVERISSDDYKPTFKKMNKNQVNLLNEKILALPSQSKLDAVNKRFAKLIGNLYPIPDKEIRIYIGRILEQMSAEKLKDCLDRDFIYALKIKRKINNLATAHKEIKFSNHLDTDKIIVKPSFQLPSSIMPSGTSQAVPKSLYLNETGMNSFELKVINELANLPNIKFWHKIIEKKGFRINGFFNHYPDFLLVTESGKMILVEAKGDHLDNTDSANKLKLGHLWASRAGNNYRYFMIFENNPIENAHRLDAATPLIGQI